MNAGASTSPAAVDDAVTVRVEVGADLRDHAVVDADVERRVDSLRRVEDARAADDDVVCAGRPTSITRPPLPSRRRPARSSAGRRAPPSARSGPDAPGRRSGPRRIGDARVDLDASVHRAWMHHALTRREPIGRDPPPRRVLARATGRSSRPRACAPAACAGRRRRRRRRSRRCRASRRPRPAGSSAGGPTRIASAPTSLSAWTSDRATRECSDVADDRHLQAVEAAECLAAS